MAKNRQHALNKLKRRHFGPSVIMFLMFVCISILIVVGEIQMFSSYIVSSKLSDVCSSAREVGLIMDHCLAEGKTPKYAATYAYMMQSGHSNIYMTDLQGRMIASTGQSAPQLDSDARVTVLLDEDYIIYADQNTDSVDQLLEMNLTELAGVIFENDEELFGGVNEQYRSEWMREMIVEQKFWVQVPSEGGNYHLYVECMLQLQRQDLIYVVRLGMVTLIVLLIPLVFLFVNTIMNIYVQRKTTRVLYTDMVTGGHNWLYFQAMCQRLMCRLWNARRSYAMVDLHLEHYTHYVTCYGSVQGDELLECMDGFLQARMRRHEVFGHYGAADFGLILRCDGADEQTRRENCEKRLRSLLAELAGLQPDRKLHFHAGVYMIDPLTNADRTMRSRRAVDVDQMFHYANTAQQGVHGDLQQIFFFDAALLERQNRAQWVENRMQPALTAGEFLVYLQPKYEPVSKKLVAAEALVRWDSPDRGMISPGEFMPIFEENSFVMKLDDYMLSHVAKQQAEWIVEGKKTVPISVNLSRVHFMMPNLAEHISQLVDAYGCSHDLIELEVTESAFFDDKSQLVNTVKQLRAYGFQVSMDDFGTGYSSLNSLKDIPLDIIKLDAEFFRGEEADGKGRLIVAETIRLAKKLGMRVVAEGIEQKEQVDFLAQLGCDMIQGYYFAKPMPVDEFEARVERDAVPVGA